MAFTPQFDTFWAVARRGERRGSKEDAFRAYVKRGSPEPAALAVKWTEYLASLADPAFSLHVSTWLNKGVHLEKYGAAERAAAGGGGFVPSDYPEFD